MGRIFVNDLSKDAVEAIRRNVEYNKLDPRVVVPHHGDAIMVMMQHRASMQHFDVVDIDPFVRHVDDGTHRLLHAVTCVCCTLV